MRSVIHDQDGHADDHVATLLLSAHPAVDLRAVVVNSGDCLPEVSARVLLEVLAQVGHGQIPVAWQYHDLPCPFPLAWQQESLNYERDFPGSRKRFCPSDGTDLLVRSILESPQSITLLCTGPLSNLARALVYSPQIKGNLERVVVMAGGLEAGGNVHDQPDHDGTAEWNLYCDPLAAAICLESGLSFTFVTLDVTNFVPMTPHFLDRLGSLPGAMARVARQLLSGVEQKEYYFWDTFAALLTCEPDFLPLVELSLKVLTKPPAAGRLEVDARGTPARLWFADEVKLLQQRVEERFLDLLA